MVPAATSVGANSVSVLYLTVAQRPSQPMGITGNLSYNGRALEL